jgi:hypothetical protein
LPPSLAALLFGLALILVPIHVFPICEYAETPAPSGAAMGHASAAGHAPAGGPAAESGHMVCWYMARAELGLGLALILCSLAPLLTPGAGDRRGLHLALASMALPAILLPTVLIGVCPGARMPCRAGTLPALVILGGLLGLFSLAAAWRRGRRARRPENA